MLEYLINKGKNILLSLFIFLVPVRTFEQVNNTTLVITFKNIRSNIGKIQCAIYNQPAGWPDDGKKALQYFLINLEKNSIAIDSQTLIYTISFPLKSGKYAIACFHDENKNNRLDTNFLGLPKEGYGFSNCSSSALHIPSFEECSFKIEEGKKQTITIALKYIFLS
ncbi:MAG: DUF2141 domain-containing protein [Bacteroidia bacterium]|nr:DUF2141 domain-containing protein [Bacteroidia bacterium]MDW8159567.1 DUF2141 domain-containing protein [Bacteroidia bacterium]